MSTNFGQNGTGSDGAMYSKEGSPAHKHLPWLSPDLKEAIRRRNNLF